MLHTGLTFTNLLNNIAENVSSSFTNINFTTIVSALHWVKEALTFGFKVTAIMLFATAGGWLPDVVLKIYEHRQSVKNSIKENANNEEKIQRHE